MARFTDDQLSEFQETFTLFDTKADGKIFKSQIGEVLRAMGQNPTQSEVSKFYDISEGDDRISFEVFLPMLQTISKNQMKPKKDEMIEGFKVFDKDQSGFIGSGELRHLLTSLGEKMTDEEVEQLLQGHEDSQGLVNYSEFVTSVLNG